MWGKPGADQMRRTLANHLFCMIHGMDLKTWLPHLRRNRATISPQYQSRAMFITAMSVIHTFAARMNARNEVGSLPHGALSPPIFILGHWRSGTTFLHNLLACDPQFGAPTLLQTLYPTSFSVVEHLVRRFQFLVPRNRLIDGVGFGFDYPQEDEFALCNATTLSPYMRWLFPQQHALYDVYLTLQHASAAEIAEWKQALLGFLHKVTYHTQRTLVLKSPAHTARIRLLLELFPTARFIHLIRHPVAVFQSTKHLHQQMWRMNTLQRCEGIDLDEMVLRDYEALYERFFVEHHLIPEGNLCQVRYEDLVQNPIHTILSAYDRLSLTGFGQLHARLGGYLAQLREYRGNGYPPLPDRLQQRVHERWQRSFELWGYQ